MNKNPETNQNLVRSDQNAELQISLVRRLLLSDLPHSIILLLIIAAVFPQNVLAMLRR